MRTLRRATAVIGIVLVVLFVSFAVTWVTRAQADAAFIAAANLQTVTLAVDGIERRAAGFIVVFPEATRPDMAQPPKFGRNNPAWNDGSSIEGITFAEFHQCP